MKKLKEQLQETVLEVATAIPPLDAVGQWFKTRGKVTLAARNHPRGFWEALGPREMVLPAQKAGPGPSVKCFDGENKVETPLSNPRVFSFSRGKRTVRRKGPQFDESVT